MLQRNSKALHNGNPAPFEEVDLSDSAAEKLKPLLPIESQGISQQIQLDHLISAAQKAARTGSFWMPRYWPEVIRNIQRSFRPPKPSPTIADYQEISLAEMAKFVDVRDKTILEVGSDVDGGVLYALRQDGARFVLGIDHYAEPWEERGWVRILAPNLVKTYGDIKSLPYVDESFDLILNIATFEHIHDLPIALREMHRLLKPGGIVYAQFGPLWSSAVGHHLWCDFDEVTFRFDDPSRNPLDDFDHLLCDREELAGKLAASWDPKIVDLTIDAVFDHPHINRVFHHEICNHVRQSSFQVIEMEKSWEIAVPPEKLSLLIEKHGRESDYGCAGMRIVLKKNGPK